MFYATPQTFFIDMAKGRVDATDIVLVIVGEFAGVDIKISLESLTQVDLRRHRRGSQGLWKPFLRSMYRLPSSRQPILPHCCLDGHPGKDHGKGSRGGGQAAYQSDRDSRGRIA